MACYWLYWQTPACMCLNGAQTQRLWPVRQFKHFSVTQWIEEAALAPLFSVQGVWHLLQLTALQKDEPFVKDATRKMAPRWSGGGFSRVSDAHVQHTHTHTHIFLAFCSSSRHKLNPDWLVRAPEVWIKIQFRGWQTGEGALRAKPPCLTHRGAPDGFAIMLS